MSHLIKSMRKQANEPEIKLMCFLQFLYFEPTCNDNTTFPHHTSKRELG